MSRRSPSSPTPSPAAWIAPTHGTLEQALAVAESLQAMRQALWTVYGQQMQQAWREQLMTDHAPPEFDPDAPF